MIYFYKELVDSAKMLLDTKSIYDDTKAANDLENICFMIDNAQPTTQFMNEAVQLHRRINYAYPEIAEMHRIATTMSNPLNSHREGVQSEYDAILKDLNSDRFGIFASVLLKHGKISCIKEFIEKVD